MKSTHVFALACLVMGSFALAGCKQFELSMTCKTICDQLRVCIDDDLSVTRCRDRCVDAIDEHAASRHAAERCADCIEDNSCREIPYECRSCDEVLREFTDQRFEDLRTGRGGRSLDEDAGVSESVDTDSEDAGN